MKGIHWYILALLLLVLSASASARDGGKFVVVIDAGHGGHDPGALGKTFKEKAINLSVALKLGDLLERNLKDVKVVYTRKKDVFIALNRRAEIANENKADLFVSIHTNALAKNHTMKGASTYTLGLAKSNDNLDVAMRENGVILYESGYETKYEGFDPKSSESYIIFELMQDQYMSQSVKLATLIQGEFKTRSQRRDQGVHQAGFLVLKESAMPSVLIELGFISTPEEEKFLGSESGSTSMAGSIYQALKSYIQEQGGGVSASAQAAKNNIQEKPATEKKEPAAPQAQAKEEDAASGKEASPDAKESDSSGAVFKIQFLTSDRQLKASDSRFKGLKNVSHYVEKGIYKYTYMESTDYNEVRQAYNKTVRPKFKDAFIIAFKNGQKYDVQKAIQEFRQKK